MISEVRGADIVFDALVQALCPRPYPGHPRGCPNYGHRPTCPPGSPLIDAILYLPAPVFVVHIEFDIGAHAAALRERHPEWSERQVYCCLYWQPRARKYLRAEEDRARLEMGVGRVVHCPEAHGVYVDALMRHLGVTLEWPPRNTARLVSLAGVPGGAR